MNNEIQFDENIFKSLIDDFCEFLGLSESDIIEIDSSKREFAYRKYYRYKLNKTLPFFFIELHNGSTELLIDCKEKGKSKIYEFYDDETLEALKEIIHKSLKNQFEYLKSQIVYKDDRTTIIIRENDLDKSETLMYLYYENKKFSVSKRNGKISLSPYDMSNNECEFYLKAIEKYFIKNNEHIEKETEESK